MLTVFTTLALFDVALATNHNSNPTWRRRHEHGEYTHEKGVSMYIPPPVFLSRILQVFRVRTLGMPPLLSRKLRDANLNWFGGMRAPGFRSTMPASVLVELLTPEVIL